MGFIWSNVTPLYNTTIFLQTTHQGHSLARPIGWGVECSLWVNGLNYILHWKLSNQIRVPNFTRPIIWDEQMWQTSEIPAIVTRRITVFLTHRINSSSCVWWTKEGHIQTSDFHNPFTWRIKWIQFEISEPAYMILCYMRLHCKEVPLEEWLGEHVQ